MTKEAEYLKAALLLLSDNGSVSGAARKLQVSRAAIWGWVNSGIPPKRAVQIEQMTGGVIKRHQLNGIFSV